MKAMPATKHQLQFVTSLQHTKFREKFNKFIVEGEKICKDCILKHPHLISSIFALEEWVDNNLSLLTGKTVYTVQAHALAKISGFQTPNQVLMVCEQIAELAHPDISQVNFYLDHIQDPGNLGAIIRLVDWFGLYPLYLSPGCVEIYNPKVVQASMGSIFGIRYKKMDLHELMALQPELLVYGADLQGEPLDSINFLAPGVIIIGSESHGLSNHCRGLVKQFIQIPKKKTALAESLNAANAAAIFAYQISLSLS